MQRKRKEHYDFVGSGKRKEEKLRFQVPACKKAGRGGGVGGIMTL